MNLNWLNKKIKKNRNYICKTVVIAILCISFYYLVKTIIQIELKLTKIEQVLFDHCLVVKNINSSYLSKLN